MSRPNNAYNYNKAVVGSRLRPGCATHDKYLLIFVVEQNFGILEFWTVGILAIMPVVPYRRLEICMTRHIGPLWENGTSSTKPEVHQRRQRRTEPYGHKSVQNIWWSSAERFSSYTSEQIDRQINRHAHRNTAPAGAKWQWGGQTDRQTDGQRAF